jgi:hypothetical protein
MMVNFCISFVARGGLGWGYEGCLGFVNGFLQSLGRLSLNALSILLSAHDQVRSVPCTSFVLRLEERAAAPSTGRTALHCPGWVTNSPHRSKGYKKVGGFRAVFGVLSAWLLASVSWG